MKHLYDIVLKLTEPQLPSDQKARLIEDFAFDLGWRPSDKLSVNRQKDVVNEHLVVEHGLENTAVISFLNNTRSYSDLGFDEKQQLIEVSYNNLVDWHIAIEPGNVTFIYNRTKPLTEIGKRISRSRLDYLRRDAFERIIGNKPNPNLPSLDEALINTISKWKRHLSAELNNKVTNAELSSLFNAIIFVRAAEDNYRRISLDTGKILLDELDKTDGNKFEIAKILQASLSKFVSSSVPKDFIDSGKLKIFNKIGMGSLRALIRDFYRSSTSPYNYDFSLMSKHALSRIYEHYVSILRVNESPQKTMFAPLPGEVSDKAFGSVYTPEFVARFFCRYLQEQLPPTIFRKLKIADPACGSGIFLRTHLEIQCDPIRQRGVTKQFVEEAAGQIFGLDIDENACQATRLSIALLHLVLTGELPNKINVLNQEAIEYFLRHPEMEQRYDAIMANPPFVSTTSQPSKIKERVASFLKGFARGRIDLYQAFLLLAVKWLKPGGFGMFVLPHSFLLGQNSKGLRNYIYRECWVRCLADLSSVEIFKGMGTYTLLLIFQKKLPLYEQEPNATMVKCKDRIGQALEDVIDGRVEQPKGNSYSIYHVGQKTFSDEEWLLLPPAEMSIQNKLQSLPRIEEYLYIGLGYISGMDNVFVLDASNVPKEEVAVYRDFLPDREIKSYIVPANVNQKVFYPYMENRKISEEDLKNKFPKTWAYLKKHKSKLESRGSVIKGTVKWWSPERPRVPKNLMRPKIVTPHLVIIPKFAVDTEGEYAVSRSPVLIPKGDVPVHEIMLFLVAVLNSSVCFWYISKHSHVYSKGYLMLEPKTLKLTPVPDPSKVQTALFKDVIHLVKKRMKESDDNKNMEIEHDLDLMISKAYGISKAEQRMLNIDDVL